MSALLHAQTHAYLKEILEKQGRLFEKFERIERTMATADQVAALQASVNKLTDAVAKVQTAVSAEATSVANEIARVQGDLTNLSNQLAQGQQPDAATIAAIQASLDAATTSLTASVQTISTQASNLDAVDIPAAAPAPVADSGTGDASTDNSTGTQDNAGTADASQDTAK